MPKVNNTNIMNRTILSTIILFLGVVFATQAQTYLGVRGGVNISSMSTSNAQSRIGFKAGAMLSTYVSDSWCFQPSVLVTLDGSKAADKYKPKYSAYTYALEVPLIMSKRWGDEDVSIGLDMGVFGRYAFDGNYWTNTTEGRVKSDIFKDFKRFDVGPQVGFSVIINSLYIGSSFQMGLIKPWDGKRGNSYSYGINIGYLFELY